MAYYRLSKVIKMRREAMGHDRFEYDVDGPSFMTVYRLEEGKVRVKEKTYRKLSRAMGEEESTRQGLLKTKDIRVLWLMNEISNGFLRGDYEKVEMLIVEIEKRLDCKEKRNQQYLDYVKARLQYDKKMISSEEYDGIMRSNLCYGKMKFEEMMEKTWPFHEREWQRLIGIVEMVRKRKDYEQQQVFLMKFQENLEAGYMETAYSMAYWTWVRLRTSDVLGNLGYHREAIALAEETCMRCEEKREFRYLAELYYSIFWDYVMIKEKETLTEQEEARCKECLLKAYYINKAWYPPKKLYELRLRECYPEEI